MCVRNFNKIPERKRTVRKISSKMAPKTQNSGSKCQKSSRGGNKSRTQLSQSTLEQSFNKSKLSEETLEKYANNCVRYILYRAGNNLPIKKSDMQQNIVQGIRNAFDPVINKAKEILNNVYGYDLFMCERNNGIQLYIVSNLLPYVKDSEADENEEDVASDAHKIVFMLVLSHIFMLNASVTEASLFSFLKSLNIDPDERHDVFGNVKEIVTTMVKQKYLAVQTEVVSRRNTYSWGPRAEHEVSKHKLLKFVCNMYKDRTPKSWVSQLEAANEQNQDHRFSNGVASD